MGLEWIKYILTRVWHLDHAPKVIIRGCDMTALFDKLYRDLPKHIRKRIKYYRPYVW